MRRSRCDIVLAESLDRFSRDQEHIAAFYKQVSFVGAKIFTLSEGEVSELHIGLKGTMGALYLKELAAKTHRGLAGRVLAGRCLTLCYGYRKIHRLDQNGELERGLREIDEATAPIVRRIFAGYADGLSPRAIARALDDEGVPGPTGGMWYDSAIRGRPKRSDGMLRNELYAGRFVWNRLHNTKDPVDGTRVRRANPQADLVSYDMPELAIVDQETWNRVQARLILEAAPVPDTDCNKHGQFWNRRRPRTLLTRKVVCGVCGRTFVQVGKDYLACFAAATHGCSNKSRIRRPKIEAVVLDALGQQLMQPGPADAFAKEFARGWVDKQKLTRCDINQRSRDLKLVERRIGHLIDALAEGIRAPDIKARLADLEQQKTELSAMLANATAGLPLIPADLAEVYREKLTRLSNALTGPDNTAALEIARGLIDKVIISPPRTSASPIAIELIGNLTNLLNAGGFTPKPSEEQSVQANLKAMLDGSVKEGSRASPLDPAGA